MEGHWKFLGGREVLKVNFLEAMHKNKLEFPGGWGCAKAKTCRVGSMDVFWNCTIRIHFFTETTDQEKRSRKSLECLQRNKVLVEIMDVCLLISSGSALNKILNKYSL